MQSPVLSREEELHWLALKLVPGLGTRTSGKLIERFRTPQAIFRASRTELEGAGVTGAVAQSIASGCAFDDAVEQQQKMAQCGSRGWSRSATRAIPPRCGRSSIRRSCCSRAAASNCCSRSLLGVVGTRRPTAYGIAAAERLSGDLARAGLTIVSGMARGIDTAAHKGALAAEGDTVAVLGCGVDVVYPSENRKLAADIAAKGLMISEFPMGADALSRRISRSATGSSAA